jgi:ABC-type bacteriocin/lantibiotic exporter with double-glycine peptidase domain
MCYYHLTLAVICIGMALLNVLILRFSARYQAEINKSLSLDMGKLYGIAMNGLQMIETYKATGTEVALFRRWAGQFCKVTNAQQKTGVVTQLLEILSEFIVALNNIVVLGLGGYFVMQGKMTIGTLVAFQSLLMSFSYPFSQLIGAGNLLQEMHGDMNRLDDVMAYPAVLPANIETDEHFEEGPKLTGQLSLSNITFGYNRLEPPMIQEFSLMIQSGQRIGIVGSSSSGRSTIASLVMGLYEPWEGQITFDGKTRDAIPVAVLRNSVSLVSQKIQFFEGTVLDNVRMWDKTIAEEDVVKAAQDANIHEIIAARDGGYDSVVMESGKNFSGGERQRLEIARALATNPSLLILDEATSALDPPVEDSVMSNIKRRGCSCLIIAHRLSTIRDCDEIIVFHEGRIQQRGTHEQLITEADGLYVRLLGTSHAE